MLFVRFWQYFLLCWCLNLHTFNVEAQANGGYMETLLYRLWDQANETINFIIAPQEIFSLYKDVFNDADIKETVMPALHCIFSNRSLERSDDETQTSLINSVTIEARWAYNFHRRDGHKRIFHNTQYANVYTDFMRKDDIFYYTELPIEYNGKAVEIPLHKHQIKMIILLPNSIDGLPQLEQQIFRNLSAFQDVVIGRLQPMAVRVYIPKFKINGQVKLKTAFEQYAATTTNTIDNHIVLKYIDIVQRVQLEVNEMGVGESNNTTVLFWNASSSLRVTPKIFEMNHPFLFLIRNTKGIQFVGRVLHI